MPTAPTRRARTIVETIERLSTGRLFATWLLMIVVAGVAYWLATLAGFDTLLTFGTPLQADLKGLLTAVYFSFVTATSVGYGDVTPLGLVRVVAIAEAVAGLLIFGAVVAKLVSRRQDELMSEIHRITFEERLDRVQSSLHLVLSDLQSIAAVCDAGAPRPERIASRLESATHLFAGELRATRDLLYRPQWAPEEAVLEAIVASLAIALAQLRELLQCLPTGIPRSENLETALAGIGRIAIDICGECVPHDYAPKLKVWMDRIQESAREFA